LDINANIYQHTSGRAGAAILAGVVLAGVGEGLAELARVEGGAQAGALGALDLGCGAVLALVVEAGVEDLAV